MNENDDISKDPYYYFRWGLNHSQAFFMLVICTRTILCELPVALKPTEVIPFLVLLIEIAAWVTLILGVRFLIDLVIPALANQDDSEMIAVFKTVIPYWLLFCVLLVLLGFMIIYIYQFRYLYYDGTPEVGRPTRVDKPRKPEAK